MAVQTRACSRIAGGRVEGSWFHPPDAESAGLGQGTQNLHSERDADTADFQATPCVRSPGPKDTPGLSAGKWQCHALWFLLEHERIPSAPSAPCMGQCEVGEGPQATLPSDISCKFGDPPDHPQI